MKTKRIIILLVSICAVVALGFYANKALKNEAKSDPTELINFEIENVDKVTKIVIYDPLQNKDFEVNRKNGEWSDRNGECVQSDPIKNLLDAFRKITFKGYVNENLKPTVTKYMAASAIEVDIYVDGELEKTWYVGHGTPDHHGTYMLLETPEIKSDLPVIMTMDGLNGILKPRFFVDEKQWACSDLFSVKQESIKSVSLKNTELPGESYEITIENGDFVAKDNGQLIPNTNHQNLLSFLNAFENIHFNQKNYTMSEMQIDSLRGATPHYILGIEQRDGTKEEFKFYKYKDEILTKPDSVVYSLDYMWTFTQEDELVRVQFGGKFGMGLGPVLIGRDVFVDN